MKKQEKKWNKVTIQTPSADEKTRKFIQGQLSETRIFIDTLLRDRNREGFRLYTQDLLKSRGQTTWVRPK